MGNEMYEEFKTVLGDVCNRLFSSGEDRFRIRGLGSIESYLEDIMLLRRSFTISDIVHVPRTENIKADRLVRSPQI